MNSANQSTDFNIDNIEKEKIRLMPGWWLIFIGVREKYLSKFKEKILGLEFVVYDLYMAIKRKNLVSHS